MKQVHDFQLLRKILLGAAAVAFCALLVCMALAVLIDKEVLNLSTSKLLGNLIANVLLMLACWWVSIRAGKGRMQISGGVLIIYLIICLLGKYALRGSFVLDWRICLPIVGALIGAIMASRKKVHRK